MFFRRTKTASPRPADRRGQFRSAVHAAIVNATSDYQSQQWGLYRELADDLQSFSNELTVILARCRPA